MNCDFCVKILKDMIKPHAPADCPLRSSYYCSTCAKTGHLFKDCPAKPQAIYTQPSYLEQLIPPSELLEFKITSKTPIDVKKREFKQLIIEIKDSDASIKSYLALRGIKVKEGFKAALESYAKVKNRRIVYKK